MFVCTLCTHFAGRSFSDVLRHIGSAHSCDPGLSIPCGIKGCPEIYTKFESFRSHVYRKHRDELHNEKDADRVDDDPTHFQGHSNHIFLEEEESLGVDRSCPSDPRHGCSCLQHNVAKFLLKTKEECKLTQAAMNSILSGVKGLCEQAIDGLKQKVVSILPDGRPIPDLEVESIFNVDLFDGLGTQYLQQKYYEENFHFVAPTERVLGREVKEKNGRSVEQVDCCYDIPLHESLQSLLKMNMVYEQVMNSHSLFSGQLGDYCDGDLFLQHPLFVHDPCALQIQLYYDELEVCNPLGSKKHKLGLFYYTLGNLNPALRSSLKSIHLLCVAKYTHIVKYGIEEVAKPIVEAIKDLEKDEGVMFDLDDRLVSFRGTLTIFSADNLAAWAIGGFKALASAFRKCQYCMVTMDDMQSKFREDDVQLRTKELYKVHCEGLNGPLSSHVSTTYGMVCNSFLNDCKYRFHVTEGLVPDVMHDILEGSLEVCLKQLLIRLIKEEKIFTLELLNERIDSFNFGPGECKNVPSKISALHLNDDGKIKQSAAQMWCLGRFLPILVGDLVPYDHIYWSNYLTLLDIVNELFAPVTHPDRADYVAMLVEAFLESFKELYPLRPLTPKMHYMVHMGTWIKRCGPLVHQWCMRYEAKHSYFKQISNVVGNFKNLPKTLANRHQNYMCYQMLDPAAYLRRQTSYTGVSRVVVGDMDTSVELQLIAEELNDDTEVFRVRSATINNTMYSRKSVLVLCAEDDLVFTKITDIIITPNQECLFVVHPLTTYHNYHFHCIDVQVDNVSTADHFVCRYDDLVDHHPLFMHQQFGPNGSYCLCLKYNILPKKC